MRLILTMAQTLVVCQALRKLRSSSLTRAECPLITFSCSSLACYGLTSSGIQGFIMFETSNYQEISLCILGSPNAAVKGMVVQTTYE